MTWSSAMVIHNKILRNAPWQSRWELPVPGNRCWGEWSRWWTRWNDPWAAQRGRRLPCMDRELRAALRGSLRWVQASELCPVAAWLGASSLAQRFSERGFRTQTQQRSSELQIPVQIYGRRREADCEPTTQKWDKKKLRITPIKRSVCGVDGRRRDLDGRFHFPQKA